MCARNRITCLEEGGPMEVSLSRVSLSFLEGEPLGSLALV